MTTVTLRTVRNPLCFLRHIRPFPARTGGHLSERELPYRTAALRARVKCSADYVLLLMLPGGAMGLREY